MTSALPDIYTALAGKSVTVRGQTPRVYQPSQLKDSVNTTMTPCRLLLPLGTPMDGRDFQFIALGKTSEIAWNVVDLMLWKPTAQGLGLAEVSDIVIEYCAAYTDMLRTFRAPTAQSYLETVLLVPGQFEWPVGSGKSYVGVEITLTIREINSGS